MNVMLCEGHEIKTNEGESVRYSIFPFPNTLNPLDLVEIEATADDYIQRVMAYGGWLHLYVTGLTVALVAVMKACSKYGVKLILWHYDIDSGKYYPQGVEKEEVKRIEVIGEAIKRYLESGQEIPIKMIEEYNRTIISYQLERREDDGKI